MWDGVIGQDQAVGRLRGAVEQPSHAYLLAGPRGSGVLEAARCFAAALVCPAGGCGACNACRRARSGRHPDVIEVEPAGTFVVVDQVEEMMKEAFTSPFEADRKVIVVTEADRLNEPAANKLLKTLEEPPARTHFLLLSEAPDELLPTVRSRCQRVDFAALCDTDVVAALVAAGDSGQAPGAVEPPGAWPESPAGRASTSGRSGRRPSPSPPPSTGRGPPPPSAPKGSRPCWVTRCPAWSATRRRRPGHWRPNSPRPATPTGWPAASAGTSSSASSGRPAGPAPTPWPRS